MFCTKCGNKLEENSKFCISCGTPVPVNQSETGESQGQTHTPPNAEIAKYTSAAKAEVTQLAQKLSLSIIGLGACAGMAFVFVYNLFNYLGPWHLSFLGLLSSLIAPALFAWLIFAKAQKNGKHILFAVPFALRAFVSLSISDITVRGWLTNLSHVALAVLFILTIFGKFSGKKAILALSGASAAVIGLMAFRFGFMSGVVQIVYFMSVFAMIYEFDIEPFSANKVDGDTKGRP